MPQDSDKDKVRQGTGGKRVLYILIAGLALVILLYLITGLIGGASQPDSSLEEGQSPPPTESSESTGSAGDVTAPDDTNPTPSEGSQ